MNAVLNDLDPMRRLILAYARSADRDRYAVVFALDQRFADIIRSTSEMLIGQMRLTWWRDILTKKPDMQTGGEPLVAALQTLDPAEADSDQLVRLIDGWEYMLDDFPWDDRQFDQYAERRGEGLFAFALGRQSPLSDRQRRYARAWALWDFARHCSDPEMRQTAFEKARELVGNPEKREFDRSGRPLSILCKLMLHDVKKATLTADFYRPSVAGRIILHGMTGF